jgi:hypothetical protein
MISSNPYHPLCLQRELLTHGWGNHGWLMERRRWWWWWWSPLNPRPGRVPEWSFWFWIAVSDGGGTAEWYVANISIIFDDPCLFYTNCYMFCLHFVALLWFILMCTIFLFYTLMCRNYQEYKWKPCWSQIGTFQKSVLELFSKMVTLQVEDGVK